MSSRYLVWSLTALFACGSESSGGPITGPVAGQIGNQPFSVRGARADWSDDGKYLSIAFAAEEMPPCAQPHPAITGGWVEFDVNLVRANALPGKTGSYEFRYQGPSDTHASAAAAQYGSDGSQNVTLPSSGRLTVDSVSTERIKGSLTADDGRNGLSVRGTFDVTICPPKQP